MASRILAATRKGLFTIDRTGGRWKIARAQFLGDEMTLAAHDARDGSIYAIFKHGHFGAKIHRSTDGGATFAEVGVPVYPAMPADEQEKAAWSGKPFQWSLELVWAFAPGGKDEPGVLWAGTIPGGLFRSEDHGKTWQLNEALWFEPKRKEWVGGGADLPGIHSICVHPEDSRQVAVGVSLGGVWVTQDGGASWACQADGMIARYMPPEQQSNPNAQDPHQVVQCAAAPDTLWAQHHNGIFKTTDGCRSWHEIKEAGPSTFGFAVAVHPRDPKTAWFVPAVKDEKRFPDQGRVVVTRTRDGGKSFDVLTRGLPQEHAYDLTYRHGLDVDETGKGLAFGTTTGSLWVSEDQGDSWQTVAEHLPPVYCVRFVKES